MSKRVSRSRDAGHVAKQVNPLKAQHQDLLTGVDPMALVAFPRARPLVVDVGCGAGEWVLEAAMKFPDLNFLGIDVRPAFPEDSGNAKFVQANASAGDVAVLLKAAGSVRVVLAQYCDPNWKKKHHKRRMVTPSLCRAIALALDSNGYIGLRTDVLDIAKATDLAAAQPPSLLTPGDETLVHDFFHIPTERELYLRRKHPSFQPYIRVFQPIVIRHPRLLRDLDDHRRRSRLPSSDT